MNVRKPPKNLFGLDCSVFYVPSKLQSILQVKVSFVSVTACIRRAYYDCYL